MRLLPADASGSTRGAACMVAGAAWFSVMAFSVRLISPDIPAMQIILVRNILGLALFLPWYAKSGAPFSVPKAWPLYMARSVTAILSVSGYYYALQRLPLPTVVSVTFSVPLITAALAVIFLKERMGARRWSALGVGFLGVLLVAQPHAEKGSELAFAGVLFSSLCWAVSGILVKKLSFNATPQQTTFGMFLTMVPFSLLFVLWSGWKDVSLSDFCAMALLTFCAVQGQIFLAAAYKHADVGVVLPFDYLRLVFAGALAYAFFDETLTPLGLCGVAVIIAANLYVLHRERRMKK